MNKYLEKVAMRAYDRVRMLKHFGADKIEGESHKAFLRQARKQDPETFKQMYSSDSKSWSPELKRKVAKAREGVWKKTQGESYLQKDQVHYLTKMKHMADKKGLGTEFYSGIRDGKLRSPNFGPARAGMVSSTEVAAATPGSVHLHPGAGKNTYVKRYKDLESNRRKTPNASNMVMHEISRLAAPHSDYLGRMSGAPIPRKKLKVQKQLRDSSEKRLRKDFLERLSSYGDPSNPEKVEALSQVMRGSRAQRLLDKTRGTSRYLPKRTSFLEDTVHHSKDYIGSEAKSYKSELTNETLRNTAPMVSYVGKRPVRVEGNGDYVHNMHRREYTRKHSKRYPDSTITSLGQGKTTRDLIVSGANPDKVVTNTTVGAVGIDPKVKYMTRDYTPGKHRTRNFQSTEPQAPVKQRGSIHNVK